LATLFTRYCFLGDWIAEGTIRASELTLTEAMPLTPNILYLLELR
jgi:hypothetical protein